MLRSSLASVLSSISTRSRLSTRLFCATATSTDDQITTVRLSAIRWQKAGMYHSMSAMYWGENDPRNYVMSRTFAAPVVDERVPKLQSIIMALKQGEKDGSKRIRVQIDMDLTEFDIRQEAQKFESDGAMAKANIQNSIPMLCAQIVKYMDEIEVIFEYRAAYAEYGKTNQVVELVKEGLRKQYPAYTSFGNICLPDTVSDWTITPTDALPLEGRAIPTVYVKGWRHYSNTEGASASLWVPQSIDHLDMKQRPTGSTKRVNLNNVTHRRVEYVAIREAIKEAQELNLPEFQVVTPFLHFIQYYKWGWRKLNGTSITDEDLYLEIKALTETTKVHFKGIHEDSDDEFMIKVHEMAKNPWPKPQGDVRIDLSTSDHLSNKTITPNGALPLEGRIVPTVYVRGKNELDRAGAAVSLWVPESIEHLDVKQRPPGSIERLTIYPVTHFRAQLMAIINAIKEAQTYNLPEIEIVTDCLPFMHYFMTNWKNADGSSPAFENMYLEIKALTEKTKVHFKGVRLSENPDDEFLKKVHEMAKEALKSPVQKQVD